MKQTWSRLLSRPDFWATAPVQLLATAQLWVALEVVFVHPGTSFRDHLGPWTAVFAVVVTLSTLLSPLLPGVLKDEGALSDEQSAALELALRTGELPLASLFADWGPDLAKRRQAAVSGRLWFPVLMAGVIALNLYGSAVDPAGAWFYWISALCYAVLAVTGEVHGRRLLRRIRTLQHQLDGLRLGAGRDS